MEKALRIRNSSINEFEAPGNVMPTTLEDMVTMQAFQLIFIPLNLNQFQEYQIELMVWMMSACTATL